MRKAFLLFGLIPSIALAQVTPFLDVMNHPHAAQIELLHDRGVVQGYGFGIFRPDILINRAEFLKMTMLAVFGDEVFAVQDVRCFTDFIGEEQWFWKHACAAKERGIISGYPDGSFRGTQPVILVEALKMAIESWEIPLPTYSTQPKDWFAPYVDIATARDIFDYFPYVPAHKLTRSEMAWLLVSLNEPIAYVQITGDETQNPGEQGSGECGNAILDEGEACDDGNLENGDGCSEICVIVDEPIRHAGLRIDQRPAIDMSIAQGSKNIPLIAFDVIAGRQDVRLSSLTFEAVAGSLTAAQAYRLFVDLDGDEIPETLMSYGSTDGEKLQFATIAADITDGVSIRMEVRADLPEGNDGDFLGLGFATDTDRFVTAIGKEDNRDLTGITVDGVECDESLCWITVNTQSPKIIGLKGRGNLYVTKHPTPVPSYQLLGGERTPVLLAVKLRATEEDIQITDITIGGGTNSIADLELFDETSGSPFAVATVAKCDSIVIGQFCADTDFVIKKDQERTILVRGVVNADTEGADSGDVVTLSLSANTSSHVAIKARGVASSEDLTQNNSDGTPDGEVFIGRNTPGTNIAILGSTHDIVLAKIVSIEDSLSDPDNTPVPSGLQTIGGFKITAAEHHNTFGGLNPVTIEQIIFSVIATNVQVDPSTFVLYNALDSSKTSGCSASAPTGAITVTCMGMQEEGVSTVIGEGDSIDLRLRVLITSPKMTAASSILQTQLPSLGSRADTGTLKWNDDETSFEWADLPMTSVSSVLYKSQ